MELRIEHFLISAAVGWSQLLGRRNWRDVGGDPVDADATKFMDLLEGS